MQLHASGDLNSLDLSTALCQDSTWCGRAGYALTISALLSHDQQLVPQLKR